MSAWLAAWLLAAPAAAQFHDVPEVEAPAPSEDQTMGRMMESLRDPAVAESLADRILRSRLASRITGAEDEATRREHVLAWIASDPESAAAVAIGLAQDDASGTQRFETMMASRVRKKLVFNEGARKGLFGRLHKQGKDSRLLSSQSDEIADEEQRELIKTMFEGQGMQSNRIVTQEEKLDPSKAASTLASTYYDRLGQANLRGYSPQLQSMQSALNQRRVPGAPRLIETGKLDYETLSYPLHSMRYDIGRLEQRLRLERAWMLAKALGRTDLKPEQLASPEVLAQLEAEAAKRGAVLGPRFERRRRALERAAAAARAFDAAALPSKDPATISRAMLMTLGSKEKEAARWITVAGLEEELERLDLERGFLSPELRDVVARCPSDEGVRASYLRRGGEFEKALAALKGNDERAIGMLEADSWLSALSSVEALQRANASLRKDLSRNVRDYVATAYRYAATAQPKPRWRQFIEDLAARYAPGSSIGRQAAADRRSQAVLGDVFYKIAAGDLDAAHTILAAAEPKGPGR